MRSAPPPLKHLYTIKGNPTLRRVNLPKTLANTSTHKHTQAHTKHTKWKRTNTQMAKQKNINLMDTYYIHTHNHGTHKSLTGYTSTQIAGNTPKHAQTRTNPRHTYTHPRQTHKKHPYATTGVHLAQILDTHTHSKTHPQKTCICYERGTPRTNPEHTYTFQNTSTKNIPGANLPGDIF